MRASRRIGVSGHGLLDDGLVEGSPHVDAVDRHVEHHPFVEMPTTGRGAGHDLRQGLVEVIRFDLREIAERPQVQAQQGHGCSFEQPDRAEHRAVATEAQDQVGLAKWPVARGVGQLECERILARHPELDAMVTTPQLRLERVPAGGGSFVMGDEGDGLHHAAAVRAWTRNSTLPSAPVSGEVVQPTTSQPAACRASATSLRTRSWMTGSVITPRPLSTS